MPSGVGHEPVSGDVVPLTVPRRSDLWRRVQLARALLSHRFADSADVELLRRVLDGEPIELLAGECAREVC